jgi:hypothetical protein
VQMTRTTPLRSTILQLRQIFFTDANTFIRSSSTTPHRASNGALPESPPRPPSLLPVL